MIQSERELEAAHGKGWDCLNHSFEENFPPDLGEKLFFPTLEFCCYSFLDISKLAFFFFPTREGRPRYLSYC